MPTPLEQIAEDVAKQIGRKFLNLSLPAREDLKQLLMNNFQPICVQQESLHFTSEDQAKSDEQAMKILKLLKERRSAGATNIELAELALKYTSRLSDLRREPHFYHITATRESGRIWRYQLAASEW